MKITEEAIKQFMGDLNEGFWDDVKALGSGNSIKGPDPRTGGLGGEVLLNTRAAEKVKELGVKPLEVSQEEKDTAKGIRLLKNRQKMIEQDPFAHRQTHKELESLLRGKVAVESGFFQPDEDF